MGNDPTGAKAAAEQARRTGQPVDFVMYDIRKGQRVWARADGEGKLSWWDPWGKNGWELRSGDDALGYLEPQGGLTPKDDFMLGYPPGTETQFTGVTRMPINQYNEAIVGHHPQHGMMYWDSWKNRWLLLENKDHNPHGYLADKLPELNQFFGIQPTPAVPPAPALGVPRVEATESPTTGTFTQAEEAPAPRDYPATDLQDGLAGSDWSGWDDTSTVSAGGYGNADPETIDF
jgi:hypothetical protein